MNENKVHKDIVKHLRFRAVAGVVPMHINNTPRNARHGRDLNEKGLLKGAPDMVYIMWGGRVIWHEIKTEKGHVDVEQRRVHALLESIGHKVLVTYGLNDALKQMVENGIITGG